MSTAKKITLIITLLFFASMLFLTIFAEAIHISLLPKVTAARPENKSFPFEYTAEDGTTSTGRISKPALPKTVVENGVYVLYSYDINGTKRDCVRFTVVETGAESEGYFEIVSGLNVFDKVVLDSDGELFDGCEVNVIS